MFAGDPHALVLPVGQVKLGNVPLHDIQDFKRRGWRELFAGIQVMPDFAENPGVSLCGPANHQTACPGVLKHFSRFLRCPDIAIGKYRDIDCRADFADRVVLRLALETVRPGSAMHGESSNSGIFSHFCNLKAITNQGIGACPDFKRYRHSHGLDHRIKNQANLVRIG